MRQQDQASSFTANLPAVEPALQPKSMSSTAATDTNVCCAKEARRVELCNA